ncbi:MAG: cysteine desulfurase [Zetaproteobacteria bacterium]|nr:MAG: cysteine desulfurase [Zetaproteobacteria bacterium]
MLPQAIARYGEVATQCGGNPSSLHWAGRAARRALDDARDVVADHFGVEAGSVVFTSGGTEANSLAIQGWLHRQAPGTIVSTMIEHPSVLRPLERFAPVGDTPWRLVRIRPRPDGAIDAEEMIAAIDGSTRLVSIMAANNESGVLQPALEVARACRARDIAVHVDAVQLLGKVDAQILRDLAAEADFLTFSAHKIGGPKGVGGLIIRRGRTVEELAPGGGQERKRRSGTENVPGICAFAASLGVLDFPAVAAVRDRFEQQLIQALPDCTIIGADAPRLPNTSLFTVPGMEGETVLMQLDLAGFAVASGSACSSGARRPSHVLMAMGLKPEAARSAIRVSFGPEHDDADADALVEALVAVRERLQRMRGGAWGGSGV